MPGSREQRSARQQAPTTHLPPAPAERSGRGVWIALSVAAAVLVLGGGALLGFVLTKSDPKADVADSEAEVSSVPTTAPPTTGATPTLPPETVAPPTAPPQTQPPATAARVTRTCGAGGGGDCFVSLRPGPSSNGSELGRLNEGATVNLVCQQLGQSVLASSLGYPTAVWARSADGRWLSMAFLDAPGWSLTDVTVPC